MGSKCIVSGSEDAKIYIWDLQTREVLQILEGHRGELLSSESREVLLMKVHAVDVVLAVAVSPSLFFRPACLTGPLTRHIRPTTSSLLLGWTKTLPFDCGVIHNRHLDELVLAFVPIVSIVEQFSFVIVP